MALDAVRADPVAAARVATLPTLGYVSVYPLTMILRIVAAEVLVLLLAR